MLIKALITCVLFLDLSHTSRVLSPPIAAWERKWPIGHRDWTRYQYNHDNGYGAEAGSVLKSLHAAADPASPHGSVISFQGNLCNQPTAIFFAKNNCTSSSFTITVTVKPYPRFAPPPRPPPPPPPTLNPATNAGCMLALHTLALRVGLPYLSICLWYWSLFRILSRGRQALVDLFVDVVMATSEMF